MDEYDDVSAPLFHGGCMGVDFSSRGPKDDHVMVTVCVEDDGNWHRKLSVSSFWLDELIQSLTKARRELKSNPAYELDTDKQGNAWGYRLKRMKKKLSSKKKKVAR